MGFGFNPSGNVYTERLLSKIGSLALEERKEDLRLKQEKEKQTKRKMLIEELSKKFGGGLMGDAQVPQAGQQQQQPYAINPNYEMTGKGEPLVKNPLFRLPKQKEKQYLFQLPPKEIPTQRKGGFLGIGGKNVPQYNEMTQKVLSNIKTTQDLEELMENRKEYEKAGVDLSVILKYFMEQE